MSDKAPDAFRNISEVSEQLNVPSHVLRFWETKFSILKPVKRRDGRRMYRPEDVQSARAIQQLLHIQGLTIKGALKVLKEQGVDAVLTGDVRLGNPVQEVIDPAQFKSPAANPVQRLQKTVNDVVESGVFSGEAATSQDRLATLLQELDSVKSRIDAVLVKDAA